jgi:hypothetical protein
MAGDPIEGIEVLARTAQTESDLAAIANVDASFSTDNIYRVVREPLGFQLEPKRLDRLRLCGLDDTLG